ncbi:hypothetical protein GCM10008938_18970 [Deinococcus roseus]|uniref:Lipoprotein n=2 Tax=Deinococcus roseus TaxID=392414 RepID=A0ABQ2CYB7_9DEIO|nr:hypothetical protein GCM10008938_18970 [Deinococcus roseus]
MLFATLALSLSSCTIVIQDFDMVTEVRPAKIKVWYCPSDQKSYDFSFQTSGTISSYEAILMPANSKPNPNTALGSLEIFLKDASAGTFKNTVTLGQDQVGMQKLNIVVRPLDHDYELYVRTMGSGSSKYSDFYGAAEYIQDCR